MDRPETKLWQRLTTIHISQDLLYSCAEGGVSQSHFEAEHCIQEVVCVPDICCDETMTLQKQTVLCGAPLLPLVHTEGLEQPTTRARSIFMQEDLAEQESTPWQHGDSACVCRYVNNSCLALSSCSAHQTKHAQVLV